MPDASRLPATGPADPPDHPRLGHVPRAQDKGMGSSRRGRKNTSDSRTIWNIFLDATWLTGVTSVNQVSYYFWEEIVDLNLKGVSEDLVNHVKQKALAERIPLKAYILKEIAIRVGFKGPVMEKRG